MIFGEGLPKIINTSTSTSVLLDHAVILKNEPEYDRIIHQSEISGDREIYTKGYHWIFDVRINLWKEAAPATKFSEIYAQLNEELTLYVHRDRNPIKDKNGDVVKFFFLEMNPWYLNGIDFARDVVNLKFISIKYVDIDQSTTEAILITEVEEEEILTEDGEEIIIG